MSPLLIWIVVVLVFLPIVALSIYAVVDLVGRDDISGGRKAVWIAGVAFVPLLGGALYLIFRPLRPDDIRGFGRLRRQQRRVDQLLSERDEAASKEDGTV